MVTFGLFIENALQKQRTPENVKFTLKDRDAHGYPSLYRLYMEASDITEWDFANAHFDSYDHWLKLCDCDWFKPYLTKWRRDLEVKLKSQALKGVIDKAASNDKDKLQALKYLLDKGYTSKEQPKRGRPSKLEIAREVQRQVFLDTEVQQDLQRISKTEIN